MTARVAAWVQQLEMLPSNVSGRGNSEEMWTYADLFLGNLVVDQTRVG